MHVTIAIYSNGSGFLKFLANGTFLIIFSISFLPSSPHCVWDQTILPIQMGVTIHLGLLWGQEKKKPFSEAAESWEDPQN